MNATRFVRTLVAGAASSVGAVSAAAARGEPGITVPASTIVDVAVADGHFKTLAAALEAAGLVETLNGDGPFTVFAPTDDAFAKLPAGTVQALLKDKTRLTAILTYHVVAGRHPASEVASLSSLATVNGTQLTIDARNGGVIVGGAHVVKADIPASNGIIHVIDTVLIPND